MPFKENYFIGMELIDMQLYGKVIQFYICAYVYWYSYAFSYCFPLGFMSGY